MQAFENLKKKALRRASNESTGQQANNNPPSAIGIPMTAERRASLANSIPDTDVVSPASPRQRRSSTGNGPTKSSSNKKKSSPVPAPKLKKQESNDSGSWGRLSVDEYI